MEISPKSSQEIAAQINVDPYISDHSMSIEQARELHRQAQDLKFIVEAMKPYMKSDEELDVRLKEFKNQAEKTGVWQPTKGQGANERITYSIDQFKGYGYSEEEASLKALDILEKNGYLNAIKEKRREQERLFKDPISEYVKNHDLADDIEKEQFQLLLKDTVDLTSLTSDELTRLSHDFPSGNFLYHGSGTEQLIRIIDSGALMNARALYERENKVSQTEDRDTQLVKRNSGYEGISWSMNGIDALPGDRYHLAGFIAAPEAVLGDNQQLAVPSRPAPNEVLQMSGSIEATKFYDAKTQLELYRDTGIFSEINSVFGNLSALNKWQTETYRQLGNEPMLYKVKNDLLSQPDYQKKLRDFYTVESDGKIRLSSDLLQQTDNDIPVAAVWLQAAIDTGRLSETQFAGQELSEIIAKLNAENVKDLLSLSQQDWQTYEHVLDEAEKMESNIEVSVENMWFVAPRKDASMWFKVFARSQHKPAGILLYDDKKVRLENFASSHRGDHTELTHELQQAIMSDNVDYIDYSRVLGTEFTEDMRAGYQHQVIAERYLSNRSSIRKDNGWLIIEKNKNN